MAVVVGARPVAIEEAIEVESLATLRQAAERTETELLWIVGEGAEPLGDALQALLAAEHEPAASLPVDAAGAPVEAAVGRFAEHDLAALVDAARERRVPLRHTRVSSLLVGRETVLAHAPPDPSRFGEHAGSEWTARVFAAHPAVLVPASTVRVAAPEPGSPVHAIRAARAGGWGKGEMLRALGRSLTG